MYSKLMWCGISLLLNKLKPEYIANVKSLDLEVIESNAKNNKYFYTFRLNDRLFNCEYVFATNVCVYGMVTITDVDNNIKNSFTTEHLSDATKCSTSVSDFNEFYTCYNKCFIDITVKDSLVTDIATLEAIKIKSNKSTSKFNLKHVSIGAPISCELSPIFIKTLFAATAAMDYDTTKCHDPIFIGKGNINITLFDHSDRRIICLTNPADHIKDANIIQLINSEFKQIIQYNTPHSNSSKIEEYVMGDEDNPVRRRNYTCACNVDMSEITVDENYKFTVQILGKDIFFLKA